MSKIKQMRAFLERQKGERDILAKRREDLEKSVESLAVELKEWEEANAILQVIAQKTQDLLKFHISDIVNTALGAVFDTPYEIKLDFVFRRGRTELDIEYYAFGQKIAKLSGGERDAVAYAFQLSIWSLQRKKVTPTILMDEPLKWLKGRDLPSRGGEMMKYISEKVGLQMIAVSHVPEQIHHADRVIHVKKSKKYSRIIKK